jgi:tetratricopeptide (TPR) repeat protein
MAMIREGNRQGQTKPTTDALSTPPTVAIASTRATLALAGLAIALLVFGTRPLRADALARLAHEASAAGRWDDAASFGRERIALMPADDRAWAALGQIELAGARAAGGPARAEALDRAASALAEAHRRNPDDWLHLRNQASVERVSARVDRTRRAEHLDRAERLLAAALDIAPAAGRAWAEWANVAAERGDIRAAFLRLDRAAMLRSDADAISVGDAILQAWGIDLADRAARVRVADDLDRQGYRQLASLYRRP